MTKEPHADPVPADVPPIGPPAPMLPADDTVRAQLKPVLIGRSRNRAKLSRRLVVAYFAVGLVLLLAGSVAVVYLAVTTYDRATRTTVTPTLGSPYTEAPTATPAPVEPSEPLLERIGPERLADGGKFVARGERGARFEVTVRAGKFRKSGCDSFSIKAANGGYLPVELRVKVLAGEPDVTDYAFRFQQRDGTWLNTAYGSHCEKDYGALNRRLVAGRSYKTTVVFDVPNTKGSIVFVYPTTDVVATWGLN